MAPAHPDGPGKSAVKWLWYGVVDNIAPNAKCQRVLCTRSITGYRHSRVKCVLATAICVSVCPSPHSHATARTWM